MIKIITDSSSNFTQQEAEKLGITVIPLTIIFGTDEYRDGVDINFEQFYEKLAAEKALPHTAQLTADVIEDAVENALKEADEVLIMPIASVLSGTYERCAQVAEKYDNVYAYDPKCTTVMLKMLVLEALGHKDKTAKEVIEILDGYRPKIKLYAVLNTLENLRKGGRLSKTSALIGTMLKIKPVITLNEEGKVEMVAKQFGMKKGIDSVVSLVNVKNIDFSKPVFQIYTQNDGNSELLVNMLNVTPSVKENICPAIGTHIGADAAGIVYAEK